MVHSMTAFGRAELETTWGTLIWELRSVNHRYLEVAMRLPEDLRSLEPQVRQHVGRRLGRGKLDCNFRLQQTRTATVEINLNQAVVDQLLEASRRVGAVGSDIAPLRMIDLLNWPGVLQAAAVDVDALGKAALELLDRVLDELVQTRAREGQRMQDVIMQRLDSAERIVGEIKTILPEVATTFRQRLENRLAEIQQKLDPGRLEQEIVLFAQKTDVDEEIDRLTAHVAEIRDVLARSGQVGRRLDFLLQELNREANTLGSKSVDTRLINAAVELKVLIEQMREQVQNIE